jgi:hypothetical protein
MNVTVKTNLQNLNMIKTWPLVFTLIGFMLGLIPGIVQVQRMRAEVRAATEANAAEIEQLRKTMRSATTYYRNEISAYQALANVRPSKPGNVEKSAGMTCNQDFGPLSGAGSGVRSWRPRGDGRCYVEDAQ